MAAYAHTCMFVIPVCVCACACECMHECMRMWVRRAGPTTTFGRVVGHTKICAEQLCNICCEIIILYIHIYVIIMWFTTTIPKWQNGKTSLPSTNAIATSSCFIIIVG